MSHNVVSSLGIRHLEHYGPRIAQIYLPVSSSIAGSPVSRLPNWSLHIGVVLVITGHPSCKLSGV